MDTKIIISVILGTLLVSAIYSSSIFFVSAATTSCLATSKTTTICTVEDDQGWSAWECKTKDGGKTWSCKQAKTMTGDSIPLGLNDALSAKIQANIIDDNNDTKVPNDFLSKGGLLKEDSQITTEDNQLTTNKESSPTPPPCPNEGPIPPDCTMKPLLK
jgi:hypothetical protein